MMFVVVRSTIGLSPSSGKSVTKYPNMEFAPPPRDGVSQLIVTDDSVTSLMTAEIGWSKTI